jgi:hypothetical protein
MAARTRSVRCLSRPSCEIQRTYNRFSRPSARCALESAACIQTAPRNQRTCTACSNAIPVGTSDMFRSDRIPAPARPRNSNSARESPFRPCVASAARTDPRRAVRLKAACGREFYLFFRFFPRRDTRGDHTFDPQTPPSASLDGLQRLQLTLLRCRACQLGFVPIGLLHSAGLRNHSLEFTCRVACVREQEMGTLCF